MKLLCEKSPNVPFTAESVCELVPHIGRATVYRTVRMLQGVDFLCKVVLPNGEMAYAVSNVVAKLHHHHAVCTVCGRVRKFSAESIEQAIRALSASDEEIGDVIDHRIEVYDVCLQCRRGSI